MLSDDLSTLDEILANRRWVERRAPFTHYVAQSVFTAAAYDALDAAFQELFSRGFGSHGETDRFTRQITGYDAYSYGFTPGMTGPFRLFTSRAWHDMLARLTGVEATGDVNGGLHHHAVGSADGRVHNDLNPGWFVDSDGEGVNVSSPARCSYFNGGTPADGAAVRERVRAAAMLFYLSNPAWRPGDGGETGLYACDGTPVDRPAARVPPVNNSILVFECTPYSYHSFLTNRRPRNCVIMWLHRRKEEVVARWGESKIIPWPR